MRTKFRFIVLPRYAALCGCKSWKQNTGDKEKYAGACSATNTAGTTVSNQLGVS